MKRTKSGRPDLRTREARAAASRRAVPDIELTMRLMLPTVQAASRQFNEAVAAVTAYREEHPELAALERAEGAAMQTNNEAVLAMWGLLNELEEADQGGARHAHWVALLRGEEVSV